MTQYTFEFDKLKMIICQLKIVIFRMQKLRIALESRVTLMAHFSWS